MNHDDKTVELELPGFGPKKPNAPAPQPSAQSISIPDRVQPENFSFTENEWPWILRLVAAVAILALSIWIL